MACTERVDNPNDDNADTIQDLEYQLKKYEIDKWEKAQIRVWNIIKDEGEKASKFFLNLEKQQTTNNKNDKLLTSDGTYADKPNDFASMPFIVNCINVIKFHWMT